MSIDYSKIVPIIITGIIGLSGWGTLLYNHFSSKPKITGKILGIMGAKMEHNNKTYSIFLLYPYLINKRKSSIHVLNYELHIKVDKDYKIINRVYSIENAKELKILDLDMSDFEKKMINKKNEPFEYGAPNHGFVIFNGPPSLHGEKVQKYKLICIDALGNKHKIVTKETEFIDTFRLQELAQVELPMQPNPSSMKKIRLKVIPKPLEGTAVVLTRGTSDNRDPFVTEESGSYDLVCGCCEFPLAIKMESPQQLKNIVFHCPKCDNYNASNTPAAI